MTHSVAAFYRNITNATANHTLSFTTVLSGETLAIEFVDRTGGAVITSVTDGAGGTWTLRDSHTSGISLNAVYVRENAAAASPLVVTVATSASQNGQVVGCRVATDTPGEYPIFDQVGTTAVNPDAVASNSNLCPLSANGSVLGFQSTNNAQATAPTLIVGDSIGPAGGAGVRCFIGFDAEAAAGSYGFETTLVLSSASRWLIISLIDSGGTPPPSITNVDGDDVVVANQTDVDINGTNFDSATVDIEQDDGPVAQSVDSQDATTITFDMVFDTGGPPQLKHGGANLTVTNTDAQSDSITITIMPEADTDYVDLASIHPDPAQRITAIPDLEVGDQLQWGEVQGGTVADVIVENDATFSCAESVTAFDVRAWGVTDAEWGAWATQTIGGGSGGGGSGIGRTTIIIGTGIF